MAPTVVFDKSASICHIEGAWQRWLAYGLIYLTLTWPPEKPTPHFMKDKFYVNFFCLLSERLLKPDLALITEGGNGICFITV